MSPKDSRLLPLLRVANIARDMAPKGSRRSSFTTTPRSFPICRRRVHDHLPAHSMRDEFYKAVPKLRLVQLLSAGYDNVDLDAARRARLPSRTMAAPTRSRLRARHDAELTVRQSSGGGGFYFWGGGGAKPAQRAKEACRAGRGRNVFTGAACPELRQERSIIGSDIRRRSRGWRAFGNARAVFDIASIVPKAGGRHNVKSAAAVSCLRTRRRVAAGCA